MDPQILRAGFRIATFVTISAALLLLVEPRDSAEFVVSVMASGTAPYTKPQGVNIDVMNRNVVERRS